MSRLPLSVLAVCLGWALLSEGALAEGGSAPPEGSAASAAPRAAMPSTVFGRFDIFNDGKKQALGAITWTGPAELSAIVGVEGSSVGVAHDVGSDGNFAWKLPAGHYVLRAYELNLGGKGIVGITDWKFTVADGDASTHIGNVRIDNNRGQSTYAVVDGGAESTNRAGTPADPGGHATSLLSPIPEPGQFAETVGLCATGWGVTCSRWFTGVTVLAPPVESGVNRMAFASVDSLRPALTWQPSSESDVTYDVAIWKAVEYRRGLLSGYVRGDLVVYAEDLKDPRFDVSPALEAKTRYFWSVRLRRGQRVTTWSTANRFAFLIVLATSGRGEFFAFQTP